jgi:hypothetical protein
MKKEDLYSENCIPTLRFDNHDEFRDAFENMEYIIQRRVYYGIKAILDGVVEDRDYIILAYLNEDKFCFGSPREVWPDNLEGTLVYFEEVENYEMCAKVVRLLKRLEDEQDE